MRAILPKSNVDRLPTFEALFSAVDRFLSDEVRREEAGQLPSGSTIAMLERQKSITWIRQVLEGQPTTAGILKPMMDSVTAEGELEGYDMYANKVASQIYLPETTCELVRMSPEIHIVSRLNRLEVFRAKSPHVSTALGASARGEVPLQLWIVWPSTELHRLAKCYGDTNTALLHLDHGCFFVQMPGETVAVPPNFPHAVLALDSFYSVGHRFDISDLAHDRGSTSTHRSTISNTHVPIWRDLTWNQVNDDELSAPDYHDRRCIYCWGHPLLYICCRPVAVWTLLYGNLQHRERRECRWCKYGVRVLFSVSSYCYSSYLHARLHP
jgi:hypothetical protein